ncbi:hypothetical protein [Streptomyces sp. DSM 40750]|uniref:hypothetical protein n=1 Tax=Streptomyces sp. DSM 40750 TaxID=2801030 RepID=UPI00214B99C4|nr:hypothetical protein [Streptomyces sp. DSM 40750]UUU25530.1 hypothetical protein JIX55_37720 [Streptomyces sp. DSM 40750]
MATVVAEALCTEQRNSLYAIRRPVDVDHAHTRLPGYDAPEAVRALRDPYEFDPGAHPPAGVPAREQSWEERIAAFRERLFRVAEAALGGLGEEMGVSFSLIGAEGSREERRELFRSHIRQGRPTVSISETGSLEALLVRGDPRAASLSVLVWLPKPPMAAATVTLESALTADCTSAYRVSAAGEWELLTEDTPTATPGPGHLVFPWSLVSRADRLAKEYPHIDFQEETTSAIIQAVLNHSVPAAIHPSGDVLDSAILLVAAAHGLAVRLYDSKGAPMIPWEASKLLHQAIRDGEPRLPGVVIARDEFTAQRVAALLGDPVQDGDDHSGAPRRQ